MEKDDGSKKALIIAVSHYDLLQPLTFCMNDGNEMFTTLKSLGYEIHDNHKLIGRVKWDDLRCAIIDFFRNRNVNPKDTLLLYYSGHGVLDAYGDHNLAPSELDPFEPDSKGFPFDELTKMIDKSNSQRIVTVLDCCYSGAARIGKGGEEDAANAGRKAIDEKSRILERGEGKCILAASQAYQKAFETAQKNHSLFSYYLIEGLKGNEETVDNYGYVTPDSLGRYVYNKIMSLPPEERPIQRPIRKVQQSGDIILAYYPQFARTMTDNHFAGATRESERYHRSGKSARDLHSEGRRTESVTIDAALPVNVTYEDAIFIALVNPPSLTILKTTLSFRPYYVFDYKLHSTRIDRAGKNHKIIDEGTHIVDALNGKILYQNVVTSKSYIPDFFSKMSQDSLYKEAALNDIEETGVIHDFLNIKPEFHYEAQRISSYVLEVVEPKLPAKAAKIMILGEIIEDNTKDISYKMKFANGRVEDREMRVIPEQSEIRITRIALVHHPKWVVNFKAKEVIYTRKILGCVKYETDG
jgi:hypothetical protein